MRMGFQTSESSETRHRNRDWVTNLLLPVIDPSAMFLQKIFHQNNDMGHTSRVVRDWLEELGKGFQILFWFANSPHQKIPCS
ncbi:hypothetical protein TNCV_1013531 [Trichonephila clavipes]|uniref:Uncharacterized protein n=1 Tax=Trichonephila clavipes TaxID=2585209 RepID=A0A8X7BB02_TRICX|nr:hypothetical protein TNCV_1013531 [Trichonephila clavipes]